MGYRILAWLSLAAILVVTTLAYTPGMKAGFYFDDLPNIVDAGAVHWREISVDGFRRLFTESWVPRRPIANLSFALNHRFSGLNPTAYHWTNLVIHLLAGLLLAQLLRRLAEVGRRQTADPRLTMGVAIVVAAWFLLHPLNIQAVTYTVQRMTSMGALFYLISFSAYIEARASRGGRRIAFACAAVAGALLAAGCKENTWVLPMAIVVYEFGFSRAEWCRYWRSSIRSSRGFTAATALIALVLLAGFYALAHNYFYWSETLPGKEHSGWQRLVTQARVHWYYLSLLVWPAPSRLTLDYAFPVSRSLLEPWTTMVAVLAWVVIAGLACRWLWTRPRWGVPLVTYFLLHAVETAPINLEMVYEHRMYLPMFAIAWWLTVLLVDGLTLRMALARPALILAGLLVVALAGATYRRNQLWADPMEFHYDTANKAPNKFRPQYNLATVLGGLGRYREAGDALEQALALEPENSLAHNQLANVYLLTGRRGEAMRHYELAVRYGPGNAEAVYNFAVQLDAQGAHQRAEALYRRFLGIAPPYLAEQRAQIQQRLRSGPTQTQSGN